MMLKARVAASLPAKIVTSSGGVIARWMAHDLLSDDTKRSVEGRAAVGS